MIKKVINRIKSIYWFCIEIKRDVKLRYFKRQKTAIMTVKDDIVFHGYDFPEKYNFLRTCKRLNLTTIGIIIPIHPNEFPAKKK